MGQWRKDGAERSGQYRRSGARSHNQLFMHVNPTTTTPIDNFHCFHSGVVRFYQTRRGVLVCAEISGLPEAEEPCGNRFFAFHIHSGGQCTGDCTDPFADALTRYNPGDCPHPAHTGDLVPLFSNRGHAFEIFLTDRFTICEIVGRTVIVHSGPDDFTTQPSGNAGSKIACGQIRAVVPR